MSLINQRKMAIVLSFLYMCSASAVVLSSKPISIRILAKGDVGVCPAYPAFPDENCTGWRHTGVTLSAYTGPMRITVSGTVIDGKRINGGLTIEADNVTIKRSEINGQVLISGANRKGILLEDIYVDGQNSNGGGGGQCIGGNSSANGGATAADFVIRRANIQGCGQGVYGRGFTLEESYIHDLYGQGEDHTEAILGHTGDIVIRHNRLVAAYRASNFTGPGGMSAVIALYTHSSFWGDIDGVLVENNWLETADAGRGQAGYCLYGGNSPDNTGNASNTIIRGNVFDRGSTNKCGAFGPVVYLATGAGSCWGSGNRYEDGAIISGAPACE